MNQASRQSARARSADWWASSRPASRLPGQAHLASPEPSILLSTLSGSGQTSGAVRIQVNRKLFALVAALLGIIMVAGLLRAVSTGNIVAALLTVIVLGGPCAIYLRGLLRRGAALTIDDNGLAGFRTSRTIRWEDVSDIHLSQRQGPFGMYHRLVLTVRIEDGPPIEDSLGLLSSRVPIETIDFSIDQLAMPWSEIVTLVQDRLGQKVSTRSETWLSALRAK